MSARPTRDAYGHALIELAERDPRVVVLDADLSRSTRTEWFQARFPDRFFNLGIAEANMVGVAAGLAAAGKLPFATTYAIFIGRAFDQIRQAVCYAGANVKIVATHGGLAASYDGGSHQGIEDLALMRSLPGMTVLIPADYEQAKEAVFAAAAHEGPVYLRLQKEEVPVFTPPGAPFRIGWAERLGEGSDVALLATGALVAEALAAAEALRREGIEAEVVNVATLKPLDAIAVRDSARRCGCLVTAEEHTVIGGLYESVLGVLAGEILAPVVPVAMRDRFGETGPWRALLARFGLDADGICTAAREAVRRKLSLRSPVDGLVPTPADEPPP